MKGLVYYEPENLRLEEVEKALPKNGEVLIKVRACGICGSDVHGYLGLTGRRIPPMIMGHEFSGEIVEVDENVSRFKVGDKVIAQPINFCNECVNCKNGLTHMCLNKKFFGVLNTNGALAEYICVPEKNLYKLPESMSYINGALMEPFAVGYCGIKKCGSLKDKNVLIIGGGTIGQFLLQAVKAQNPKNIIVSDLSDKRLETAKKMGADYVINPQKIDLVEAVERITNGELIDVSIEAVGINPTVKQALSVLKLGGTSLWIGMSAKDITINMQDIVTKEYKILGSFNYTHKEFGEAIDFIVENNIDLINYVSKTVTLEETADMFRELHLNPDDYLKVMVTFN